MLSVELGVLATLILIYFFGDQINRIMVYLENLWKGLPQ